MPVTISATITKQTARRALAEITVHQDPDGNWVTGYKTYATTSAGVAGGTTSVVAALDGIGADYVLALPWLLANDLTNAGEFRRATSFSGTTITHVAFGAQVATATSLDAYPYRPNFYTLAFNRAIPKVYPGIYRYLTSHVIANAERKDGQAGRSYGVPRNMRRVHSVTRQGHLVLRDLFDRAASTTDLGNGWTAASGDTWGVNAENAYSVTDADGDYATQPTKIRDGVWEFTVRGTLAHNTTYRTIGLIFRHAEDRNGALDHDNYMVVRLLSSTTAASGGRVDLRKVERGIEASLATGSLTTTNDVDYRVRVEAIGTRIAVWVDDIQYINYELLGTELRFVDFTRWGLRIDVGGSPGTAARVAEIYAFETTNPIVYTDLQTNRGGRTFELGRFGASPSGILLVEGSEQLSLFGADSTTGALTNDSTAILELANTNEAWQTLVQAAAVELYIMLGLRELRLEAEAVLAGMTRMERVAATRRGPQLW